jgi:hypothetical protein
VDTTPGPDPGDADTDGTDGTDEGDTDTDGTDGTDTDTDGTDDDDGAGPHDPLRFSQWMKRSATGAVLSGIALGLQQALEVKRERPAFVMEAPGEPEDPDAPLVLHFDPDDPTKTVAIVRTPVDPTAGTTER